MHYMNQTTAFSVLCQGYEKYTSRQINSAVLLFPNRKTLDVFALLTEGSTYDF